MKNIILLNLVMESSALWSTLLQKPAFEGALTVATLPQEEEEEVDERV